MGVAVVVAAVEWDWFEHRMVLEVERRRIGCVWWYWVWDVAVAELDHFGAAVVVVMGCSCIVVGVGRRGSVDRTHVGVVVVERIGHMDHCFQLRFPC